MNIGVIGLGEMGSGVVRRLLAANYTVVGWNRTKAKAASLLAAGMKWGDSPLAVTEQSDLVITMVANDTALEAVVSGDRGILTGVRGKTFVDLSTVASKAAQSLGERTRTAGGVFLDGAVVGSQISLAQGKLVIMIGGDATILERVRAPLTAIGPKVFRIGEVGQAKVMKLAVNLSLATQILALSEGLLLAVRSGIDRDAALEVLLSGANASPMMQYRGPLIREQPVKAMFDCNMMQKDVELALALGKSLGVPLPTTDTSNTWLTAARGQGLADRDFSVLYYVLACAAGERLEIPTAKQTPESQS